MNIKDNRNKKSLQKKAPPPPPQLLKNDPKASRLQLIFLLIFTALIYSDTLFLKYALDDTLMITENSFTKKGISGFGEIMTNDAFTGFFGVQKKLVAGGRYRPLSQIMFATEYQFFGLNPFIGHLMNIVLYLLCVWILFVILKNLLGTYHHKFWYRSLPFLATLIFACHPIHTEVVANIKGRDEILSLLGSLATLLLSIRYVETRKIWLLPFSLVTFLLALLAKENAATFIVVIPLTLFFFKKADLKSHLLVISPLMISTIFYLILREQALGYLVSSEKVAEILNDPYVNTTLANKLATNTLTWGIYLKLLLLPHPLTHDYYPWQIQITQWSNTWVRLSAILYLMMGLYALAGIFRKRVLSYAILLYLITFSISSNLVFNVGTFMNERFMFVPLLGFALAAGWFISQKVAGSSYKNNTTRYLAMILVILVTGLFSIKTISRNLVWKDDVTLFTTDVKVSSNSTKCNVSAGGMYLNMSMKPENEGKKESLLAQAETHLTKAIEIYPDNSAAWVLLGNVYLQRKNYDKAADYYIKCLSIHNKQAEALVKLRYTGITAGMEGQMAVGIKAFNTLIKMQPDDADHKVQLADLLSKSGKPREAVALMDTLIAHQPDNAAAYAKKGEIFGRVYQDIDNSIEILQKAYSLDPKNPSAVENLGVCYGIKRDFAKSLEFFTKALELDPDNPRILTNIGNTYFIMGNAAKGNEFKQRAASAQAKKSQ